jgi:hypothetical protein
MRYGPVNVTTFVILGFALWVIYTRLRNRTDNNWPMVFYPVIVTFAVQLPGRIDINTVIAGLAAALLLRFEFVGGFMTHLVRIADMVALLAIAYYLFQSTVY